AGGRARRPGPRPEPAPQQAEGLRKALPGGRPDVGDTGGGHCRAPYMDAVRFTGRPDGGNKRARRPKGRRGGGGGVGHPPWTRSGLPGVRTVATTGRGGRREGGAGEGRDRGRGAAGPGL